MAAIFVIFRHYPTSVLVNPVAGPSKAVISPFKLKNCTTSAPFTKVKPCVASFRIRWKEFSKNLIHNFFVDGKLPVELKNAVKTAVVSIVQNDAVYGKICSRRAGNFYSFTFICTRIIIM